MKINATWAQPVYPSFKDKKSNVRQKIVQAKKLQKDQQD